VNQTRRNKATSNLPVTREFAFARIAEAGTGFAQINGTTSGARRPLGPLPRLNGVRRPADCSASAQEQRLSHPFLSGSKG